VFKISKKLNSTEKNKKYEIIVQNGKETSVAILYIPKNNKELDFNHYYKTEAYISAPKHPEHDFQFDYAKYLQRKHIECQCYSNDEPLSSVRNDLNANEKIAQKRLELLRNIDTMQMSARSKEFLKGIILADRTEMDSNTVQDFNRSGLVHFLAISGTHIVVIFGLFYFLLTQILPLKFRKYAIISSLLFIWLFALFIGLGNSVLRSCIMLSIYFIYQLLQRKPDLLHSLALSAFIILVFDTHQIFDVGFQLSFIAVLGIFWLNQPILHYFPKQDNYLKKLLFNTVSISIAAQVATLPLVLYYFHQFSFISILANFFIVPFSEVIIVFSFLMTTLVAIGIDFGLIDMIYDFIIQVLLECIHWFANADILFFENIPMNLVEVLSLAVVIYLLRFVILRVNLKNSARLIMAVFVFILLRISFTIYENRKEEVLFHTFSKNKVFSVKEGNEACFWIEENSEKDKIVQFIINPYQCSRRLKRIEIKTLPKTAQKALYNGKLYNIN
jgi:competence protein ComEC